MHPEDIEDLENATAGERTVFRFLHEATRPDADFIGWYEPAIGEQGREPDFVLFGNQHGLLVLEVKDWLIDQIEEADPTVLKFFSTARSLRSLDYRDKAGQRQTQNFFIAKKCRQ